MRKDPTLSRNMPNLWNMSGIDEMFERVFRNPFSLLDDSRVAPGAEREWFVPQVDIEETADAYLLSVDLPGLRKEDVRVDLNDNVLTVSGERKRQEERDREGIRFYGRVCGKFQRSFTLPAIVDVDKVEASLEDGVLRIALPKSEAAKPRTIQVHAGKGGLFSKFLGARTGEKGTVEVKPH